MTQRKNNISFLFLFCLMFCISACSQEYYSVNNFGKLTLHNDSSFCFHYWDCGVDSGFYKIKEYHNLYFLKSNYRTFIGFIKKNKKRIIDSYNYRIKNKLNYN